MELASQKENSDFVELDFLPWQEGFAQAYCNKNLANFLGAPERESERQTPTRSCVGKNCAERSDLAV